MTIEADSARILAPRTAPRARPPSASWLPRALDITERTLVTFAFIFFFAANLATLNPIDIAVASTDSVAVFCILLRKPADSVSLSPTDWALAIVGTVGPMFARPGAEPMIGDVGPTIFWTAGLFISVAAKLSLNRRFGVAPANRGVQVRGAYAFMRHPMYAGYALMNTAYFLFNPTWFNLIVYAIAWTCQLGRIQREESWLKKDAAYRAYAKQVRFRLIPGLF
jgi:protein-S-isoprenylcysteine O-methyltransferase Ste14